MGQTYAVLLKIGVLFCFTCSFSATADAKLKDSKLQTYRLDNIDRVAALQELENLSAQMGFIYTDFKNKRQQILNSRLSATAKRQRVKSLASQMSFKIHSNFFSVVLEPFYGDNSLETSQGRYKKYPELYKAWFKVLNESNQAETEAFEVMSVLGETASAHKALTHILESGNAKNIVYLAKQARLHLIAKNRTAAKKILQEIASRQQRESAVSLYLPDYASFIWSERELQIKLAESQRAFVQEQQRLRKLGT